MIDYCPYLGTRHDPRLPYVTPHQGNRCYARSKRVRYLFLLYKKVQRDEVEVEFQESVCFGNHRNCLDFQSRAGELPEEELSCRKAG